MIDHGTRGGGLSRMAADDSPGSYGTFSDANGNRGRANNFLLDGTDMNDGYRNVPAINQGGSVRYARHHIAAGRSRGTQDAFQFLGRVRTEFWRGGEHCY